MLAVRPAAAQLPSATSDPEDDEAPTAGEVGCYVVECPQVPVLREPSRDADTIGWLRRGDLVICEQGPPPAGEGAPSDWLRLPGSSEVRHVELGQQQRRPRRRQSWAEGHGGSDTDSSGSSSSSSSSPNRGGDRHGHRSHAPDWAAAGGLSEAARDGAAAEGANRKVCPKCGCGLEWSDYAMGTYMNGWSCFNARVCNKVAPTGTPWRWFCRRCCYDFCTECAESLPVWDAKTGARTLGKDDGYVLQHHSMLGTLLRYVGLPPDAAEATAAAAGPAQELTQEQINEVFAVNEVDQDSGDLPLEAKLWSLEQLECFVSSGRRPQWNPEPDERALCLGKIETGHTEEALRTAVMWLSVADAVLVGSGAGMGVDSGFPALQGGAGQGTATLWPALQELGLGYDEMCQARWFREDPRLAWGFWLHSCRMYREQEPHRGYDVVRSWAERAPGGGFVFTSNIDSHWASSGWPEGKLLEAHGAAHYLQCAKPCCGDTWPAKEDLGLTEDPETHRAVGDLPSCPKCGSVARPFVQMFGADPDFSTALLAEQFERYDAWMRHVLHEDDPQENPPFLVCVELGGSPGSSSRQFLEEAMTRAGKTSRLIRVNPGHPAAARELAGRAVSLPLGALRALQTMEKLDELVEMCSFVCQDTEGNGVEVLASQGATVGHILRKAAVEAGDRWRIVGPMSFKAQHIIGQGRNEKDVMVNDVVPKELAFRARDTEPLVVRIILNGVSLGGRNARVEARIQGVKALLMDLNFAYAAPGYQAKLAECTDRQQVNQLIREVHFRVLPAHGIPVSATDSGSEVALRVMQMQGYLMSANFDGEINMGMAWSVQSSGYGKLHTLPVAKPTKQPRSADNAAAQALVAVQAPAAKASAEGSQWTSNHRPPKVLWIAGSWGNWEPTEMKWDGKNFIQPMEVGKNGWESFQLLVGGRWEASLYPSVKDGNPFTEHALLGPDSKGHGRNWTIGHHAKDVTRPGNRYKITVAVDGRGAASKVSWQRDGGSVGDDLPRFAVPLAEAAEQLVGKWQYGSKEYAVSKTGEGLKFEGPHARGGTVTGLLRPVGGWLQTKLISMRGEVVGEIRLCFMKDGSAISNFRGVSKEQWGKEILAHRA